MNHSPSEDFLLDEIRSAAKSRLKGDRSFSLLLLASVTLFSMTAFLLGRTHFEENVNAAVYRKIKVSMSLENEKTEKQPPKAKKIIDLTTPAVQGTTNISKASGSEAPVVAARAVYGLRRVFAVGLGGVGGGSGALVSKLGNTLNKAADTLTATDAELKATKIDTVVRGPVTAVTTVTSKPVLETTVKPEYTDEMKKNNIQGVVSARILVDLDGLVKKVEVLNDLGFGTKTSVEEACRKLKFKPAMEGTNPVATWIVMKFRFVLQE